MGGITSRTYEKLNWPETGLASKLPRPDSEYGEISISSNNLFMADVNKYTEDQYRDYIEKCKELGFFIEGETSSIGYDAFNDEGYDLSLMNFDSSDGEMSIILDAPMEMRQITWPDSEPAILLPVPVSTKGKINSESSKEFSVYIGDTSKDEFEEYVVKCKEKGFAEDFSKAEKQYKAENADGYKLSVGYEGFNTMAITIKTPVGQEGYGSSGLSDGQSSDTILTSTPAPTDTPASADAEEAELTDTPATTVTPELTVTQAPIGTPERKDTSISKLETVEEVPVTSAQSGIRPTFKAFVDSYEKFYNEYAEFMMNYDEGSFAMITKYTSLVARAQELDVKAAAYQAGGNMTSEELKYLLDAEARVQQKMMGVK